MSPSILAQTSKTVLSSSSKNLVVVVAITSLASVISIGLLFLSVAYAALRPRTQGLKGRKDSRAVLFFRTQLGSYIACMLIANFLEGAAGLIGFSWAGNGAIRAGSLCTAQGSLITIGDFAGAYFTALTAIHTFRTLVQHKPNPAWLCVLAIAFGWGGAIALGTALTNVSVPRHGPFYASVGLWCAISSGYTVEQFVVYYLPIILCAFTIAVLYAIIYLCLRGTLVIGDGIKLNLSPENVHTWAGRVNGQEEYRHFLGSIIKSLLWFPFAYIVLFIPITIAGTLTISGKSDMLGGIAFAGASSSLTGLANVLILCNIMRILRPAMVSSVNRHGSMGSESFGTPGEMKPSPVEAPKPMNFDSPAVSPSLEAQKRMTHGRAFPRAPVSRATSPARSDASGSRPTTPRIKRVPAPRRSQDLDGRNEHQPTPQMMQEWLRHSRSNSSIGSTAALLGGVHSRSDSHSNLQALSHSRSFSGSSSDMHTFVGVPIVPSTDLHKRLDEELSNIRVYNQTESPRPSITISRPSSPPVHTPLRAAPRPSREYTRGVLDAGFQMPPMPPIPTEPEHDHYDPRTPGTGKSFATSVLTLDHEDFEIQHVDSRDRILRPALSAVAQVASAPVPFPVQATYEPEVEVEADHSKVTRSRQLSLVSAAGLPVSPTSPAHEMPHMPDHADAKSLAPSSRSGASGRSSEDMHSLRTEMRARMETPTPEPGRGGEARGGLSTLAWASLVAHAAAQPGELRSPRDSWLSDRDEEGRGGAGAMGFEPPARPRRMSDVPSVLQPGTPTSIGAGMYVPFSTPRSRGDNMV